MPYTKATPEHRAVHPEERPGRLEQENPPPPVRFLPEFFEQTCDRTPDALAVVCEDEELTYAELDRRANRLAHLLKEHGIGAGSTVGLLLDRSAYTYAGLLAVLKTGAAYVPLDPSFPAGRVRHIAQDAELSELLTTSARREQTRDAGCPVLELDLWEEKLAARPEGRLRPLRDSSAPCYVIYTSGTTGRPKGVVISHANIVSFLNAAAPVYRVRRQDRVYQGLSLAFDFSIEEIWPAWIAGATLYAGPGDDRRVGQGLTEFLARHAITVLCCVPTLLTTIEGELPALRTLLVSGEACPPDLVRRWSRRGRRILNAYGPTESTVTATCAELRPGRPVTIGRPLPGYRIAILDQRLRPVPDGAEGEICVGGPGVATGYLNRPELTAERFIANPVAADRATVPRLYRTGDLGRITPAGEIEYLGRVDTQVKIRGYRIECAEIEQLLRADPAVENAVVVPRQVNGSAQDLVGYLTLTAPRGSQDEEELRGRLHTALRRRLPDYMIPAFVEILDELPLLAADKVDRSRLPAPASAPFGRRRTEPVAPATALERQLASVWREILGLAEVSVDDDFFCDLGGHSMAAARLISRLRREPGLRQLAMGDLYAHPTIRSLASCAAAAQHSARQCPAVPAPPPRRHSTARVWTFGLAQLTLFCGWLLLLSAPVLALFYRLCTTVGLPTRVADGPGALAVLAHLGWAAFIPLDLAWMAVDLVVLPAVGARLLMGRVRPGWYPLWGRIHLRFWLHGKVLALSPARALAGSPFLAPFLRLLGARVGHGCHLATVPAVPALVSFGDECSVGYGAQVQPFAVEGGRLRLAPVTLGPGSCLGTNSVLLPGAGLGRGAVVGAQSLVPADVSVPDGAYWAGSPATPQGGKPALIAELEAAADRRPWPVRVLVCYALGALLLVLAPLLVPAPGAVLTGWAAARGGLPLALASLAVSGPLVPLTTCLLVVAVKRGLLPRARTGIHAERSPFGAAKWIADGMMTLSLTLTHSLYSTLYLVPFLRALGARTGRWAEVATVSFVDPDLLEIGERSFVADISVVAPAVFHRGRIALAPATVGDRAFVGNGALLPGGCRLGDRSLLGVHSVAPDGPIEPETTWLGSPALFLPRREASPGFPAKYTFAPTRGLIAARLAIEYLRVTLPATIGGAGLLALLYTMVTLARRLPPLVLLALSPALLLASGLACTLVVAALKWLVIGRYRPRTEPLWSVWVRRTELITGLYENLVVPALVGLVAGTPFMAPVLRLFGVRAGRRCWIDTTFVTEFDLVSIGDDAAVAGATSLQTHLFEDRVMKMSRVQVDQGSSVGARCVVLYDARVGAGASLDALSLVMKGENLPPATAWRGIPARPCPSGTGHRPSTARESS
ncbi:Pls/PosA family non-ribosomal peptide synthetase [Streptomyces orinoci]|uniref:Pls/PosA family non-ribosomal peptide synthetase n=1 Tax=Streptomyces orinoci TaxID=67339 RepID=A0ABV3K836_STRON|nr:Pls/PosA family non-ribosomal peptide synthetase [Streptomyces orinoci]